MSEFLETTVDKFTFRVATDRLYSGDGLWVFWLQPQGGNRVRVGLTDFLQQHSGGTIAREVAVLDVYRQHKELKPDGITELNAHGKQLARIMAEEIAEVVDDLGRKTPNGEAPSGGNHA